MLTTHLPSKRTCGNSMTSSEVPSPFDRYLSDNVYGRVQLGLIWQAEKRKAAIPAPLDGQARLDKSEVCLAAQCDLRQDWQTDFVADPRDCSPEHTDGLLEACSQLGLEHPAILPTFGLRGSSQADHPALIPHFYTLGAKLSRALLACTGDDPQVSRHIKSLPWHKVKRVGDVLPTTNPMTQATIARISEALSRRGEHS